LESRSLRSDFKGAVGDLWEGASLRGSFGSNLNVVSGRDQGNDVSAGANSANGPRSRLARAGPRSGPAQSESIEHVRCEISNSSARLALRERKKKTPIDISDRGQFWRRPLAGNATTSKWGLASHEPAVVVQSRVGQAWPLIPRRSCS